MWLDQDDAAAHERLARYCARCPVSLERLEYDAVAGTITYTSDKAEGPTAGRHSFEAAELIALLVAQIPDKGQVLQRYHGYYANRTRGMRGPRAARRPRGVPERRKAQGAAATAGIDGDGGWAMGVALTAGAGAGRAVGGWKSNQKGTGRARAGVKAGRERAGGAAGRVARAWHRRGER